MKIMERLGQVLRWGTAIYICFLAENIFYKIGESGSLFCPLSPKMVFFQDNTYFSATACLSRCAAGTETI